MAKTRSVRNICLDCFGDLGPDRVCQSCGKRADDSPAPLHQLKKRALLQKRYLISKSLGEGGFGITYLAWDVELGRKVAIKEYYPSSYVSRDPRNSRMIINAKQYHAACNRGLKRFIDEARHLQSIKNLGGIVTVFDFFSANNTAYIVMEYLDGISLKTYVRRKGRLEFGTALTILKPVILSLCEVHKTGLIHRDVSPDNILITKTDEVKLIDFGASKDVGPDGRSVSIVLKQGFAPEEQYRLRGEQGPWTDIYALGVTIYYCITGKLPPESIQRMYDDKIVPPSAAGAVITKAQEEVLMKAVAVFAKDRYHSLEDFMRDLGAADKLAADAAPPADKKTARTRRNPAAAADETKPARSADESKSAAASPENRPARSADDAKKNDAPRQTRSRLTPEAVKNALAGKRPRPEANEEATYANQTANEEATYADQTANEEATYDNPAANEGFASEDAGCESDYADGKTEPSVSATITSDRVIYGRISSDGPAYVDEDNYGDEPRVVDAVEEDPTSPPPRTRPTGKKYPDYAASLRKKLNL